MRDKDRVYLYRQARREFNWAMSILSQYQRQEFKNQLPKLDLFRPSSCFFGIIGTIKKIMYPYTGMINLLSKQQTDKQNEEFKLKYKGRNAIEVYFFRYFKFEYRKHIEMITTWLEAYERGRT